MQISRTLKQVSIAWCACVALFSAPPLARSASLTTTASPDIALPSGPPGATLTDTATLAGGINPTGNVVFTLTGPGGFSFTQVVNVSGNGNYGSAVSLPTAGSVVGTYTWTASYSGDANNGAARDQGGASEQTSVSAASPSLGTTASLLGSILKDTALLGGYFPTGSIVFTLTGPGGFSFTEIDVVSGNGLYDAEVTLPTTGSVSGLYTWTVNYTGDANNNAAAADPEIVSVGTTPLPGGFLLFGSVLGALGLIGRRRKLKTAA